LSLQIEFRSLKAWSSFARRHLLQQYHLLHIYKPFTRGYSLSSIEIHSARYVRSIPFNLIASSSFLFVDERSNVLTEQVVDLNCDLTGLWDVVADCGRGVEWIWVVLL
jgi:hypothetical protein